MSTASAPWYIILAHPSVTERIKREFIDCKILSKFVI